MLKQEAISSLEVPESIREVIYRKKAYPFVDRGSIYGFALKEHLVEPVIKPNESAIFSLLALECRLTYGITGGQAGHLFYFHPAFGVSHVGSLGTGPVAGGALVDIGNEMILGGWWGNDGGGLFSHNTQLESTQGMEQFAGRVTPVEFLTVPKQGEGVCSLVCDRKTRTVYGLTLPGHFLFSLSLDSSDLKPRILSQIAGAPGVLALMADGRILGAYSEGRLWSFDPAGECLKALDTYAPCQAGKRYVAGVQSLLVTSDGQVYGGTDVDGYLFRYDPISGKLINLGKPNRQSRIRALAEGHDGLIYGIVEEANSLAHFFSFDRTGQGFSDLGIIGTNFPEYWFAHSIGSMSVGPFGELFLGETDVLSHLFIYYPPVVRSKP
ncbi:MAG: hypothetical protein WC975_16335 [Phycisphaerae bacterium]